MVEVKPKLYFYAKTRTLSRPQAKLLVLLVDLPLNSLVYDLKTPKTLNG